MEYKIVYLEDQDAASVVHDLKEYDLTATHCKPTAFKETVELIDNENADLILMDFRLVEGGGDVNAPAFAQYYRSLAIDDKKKNIPIVLLSNDNKIHGFYKDYTSHDLFDYSMNKSKFSNNLEKYTCLMKELVESYRRISELQSTDKNLFDLLKVPNSLIEEIDPRIKETLRGEKFTSNIYMASAFILDNIVKPIGLLIGEDVLAARLGVSRDSDDWEALCETLEEFRYAGVYSKSYKRWWADGIESWWRSTILVDKHLRRFTSEQKLQRIREKYPSFSLKKVEGESRSVTDRFWTICAKSSTPVDPSEAFEKKSELSEMPWVDREYYSYKSLRSGGSVLTGSLTEIEKSRFRVLAQSN